MCRSVLLSRLILHLHLHLELPTAVISYLWLIALEGHMWCSHVCGRWCVTVTSCCCFSNKWRRCSVCILVGHSWFSGVETAISHCSNAVPNGCVCFLYMTKFKIICYGEKNEKLPSVVIIGFTIKSVDKLCGESFSTN